MNAIALNTPTFEELDYREIDGLEVSLLWNPKDNELSIFVADTKIEEIFEVVVEPKQARDAFVHPFAYIHQTPQTFTPRERREKNID
jgi:hypothetical protein